MFLYHKLHLLKPILTYIGKDKSIAHFLAGLHGLGNVSELVFGNNILEHRAVCLVSYQTDVIGQWDNTNE